MARHVDDSRSQEGTGTLVLTLLGAWRRPLIPDGHAAWPMPPQPRESLGTELSSSVPTLRPTELWAKNGRGFRLLIRGNSSCSCSTVIHEGM